MEFVARLRSLATARGRRTLVVLASLVLVVLIGHTLAAFVWLVVDGVPVSASPVAGPAPAVAPRRQFTPDMAADWTLFGDAAAPVPAGDAAAPETSLSLQLLGTFSTGDDRLSGAVIAERGQDGELYRVGASLPGGAVLEKVEKNQVLLRRRGQLETLRFEELSLASAAAPTAEPSRGQDMIASGFRTLKERLARPPADDGGNEAAENAARSRSALGRFAEDLKMNPDGVASELGLKSAGGTAGYVVGDGPNADLMRNLGLRPGDVIVSVNGKALGNLQNDARMVDEVKASGEARVEIRRGSQTFTVNYPL